MAHHQPRASFQSPRFAQPATFMRLPHVTDLSGLDVAIVGLDIVGCDVVEVAPSFDGPGHITSLLAANLIFEMLCAIARRRKA